MMHSFMHTKKANGTMARTSTKSAAGPTGILIGPPSKPWRVGRELGRGACGSVHDIGRVGSSPSSAFVVKIATLPAAAVAASSTAKKRKKKTPEERNADLLYQENVYYRNVLNDLRGAVVPEVPHAGEGGPPGYGDLDGECSKPGADRFMCIRLHLFYYDESFHIVPKDHIHIMKSNIIIKSRHTSIIIRIIALARQRTCCSLIGWYCLSVGTNQLMSFLFIYPTHSITSPQAFAICAWRRWMGPSRTSFPSW